MTSAISMHFLFLLGLVSCTSAMSLDPGPSVHEHQEDFQDGPLVWLSASAVLVCGILIVFGCIDWCKKQAGFKDFENEDAYGPDSMMTTGHHHAHDFSMYPPIENTPETPINNTPLYFEPLPDIATQRRLKQQHQANTMQLRPKVSMVTRDRRDSEDDLEDIVQRDSMQEKLKLQSLLTNSRTQLPRSQLQYIKELGCGWFGKVLQGEGQKILPGHKKTKVVIQMLREDMDPHDQLAFLLEGAPYREIEHNNVLKLIGQCVETTPYLTVLELSPFGDLKTYLRGHRVARESLNEKGLLLKFACDMAAGLQTMHQHNFVHRDFAIRNCMLSSDLTVKVGDYGLAEEHFKEDYYTDSNGDNIPIRWLAPETLLCSDNGVMLRYINKDSNLWSFGVSLWEVITFGSLPYSDLTNENVMRLVIKEGSVKLNKPDVQVSHLDRIYQLIQLCCSEPAQRPSLRELRIMLLHLLSRKDDPDTSAFDQKWNMLLPRRLPQVVKVGKEGVGPGPVPQVEVVRPTRPNHFESNFIELNASMLAQAGSLESELKDEFSPDFTPGVHGHLGSSTTPANELSLEAEFSQVRLQAVEDPFPNEELLDFEDVDRGEAEGKERSDEEDVDDGMVHELDRARGESMVDIRNRTQDEEDSKGAETSSSTIHFERKSSDGPIAVSTPVKEKLPDLAGVQIDIDQSQPSIHVSSPDINASTTDTDGSAYQTALTHQDSGADSPIARSVGSETSERSLFGQKKFAAMLQTVALSTSYDGDDPVSYSSSLGSISLEPLPDDDEEVFSGAKVINAGDATVYEERDTPTPTHSATPTPAEESSVVQDSGAPLLNADSSAVLDSSTAPLSPEASSNEKSKMVDELNASNDSS